MYIGRISSLYTFFCIKEYEYPHNLLGYRIKGGHLFHPREIKVSFEWNKSFCWIKLLLTLTSKSGSKAYQIGYF